MQALKLFLQNNINIPYKLGEEVGTGADGQLFLIRDNPYCVIKLCVLYDRWEENLSSASNKIITVLDFICRQRPDLCACVYAYEWKNIYSRQTVNGKQDYILYYYVMEKLNKLSEDEKKVFHSILSHEDAGKIKKYSQEKLKQILNGLKRGLDFDYDKVMNFCNGLSQLQFKHNDIHPRNIMKDNRNNFKLIDFDRCELK